MKKLILILILFSLISCSNKRDFEGFEISSDDISSHSLIKIKHVFDGFGCVGDNVSPAISWKNAPKDTKSFALSVYDPDAPTGSGWWHWVVINIPKNYLELPQGFGGTNNFVLENGIRQIRNDFGVHNFGGPCPPEGDKPHRYIFTIHALKTDKIDIGENSTAALAGFMINANTIAKASFVGRFGR